MAWHVEYAHAGCKPGQWAVVEDESGDAVSCHATRDVAVAAVRDLYARAGVTP